MLVEVTLSEFFYSPVGTCIIAWRIELISALGV